MENLTTPVPEMPPVAHPGPGIDPVPAVPRGETLGIRFTASGSEYLRIWLVNLLLIVVTAGLYLPFAKARRMRYFHENTLVGNAPLAFHGDPWRMLRGYLLIWGLAVTYLLLSHFMPEMAGLVMLAVMLAAPALMQASLRFRLGQTSWRGLRMRFTGTVGGIYRALAPAAAMLALMVVAPIVAAVNAASQGPEGMTWVAAVAGLASLLWAGSVPWIVARLKRWQHGHYALGDEQTRLEASTGDFYRLYLRLLLVAVAAIVAGLLVGLLGAGIAMAAGVAPGRSPIGMVILMGLFLVGYFVALAIIGVYLQAAMQRLLWNRTASRHVRLRSTLSFGALLGLAARNAGLMAVTLGLYWPFAQVATARLRLESVSVDLDIPAEQLVAGLAATGAGAAGVAADDLLGIDIDL